MFNIHDMDYAASESCSSPAWPLGVRATSRVVPIHLFTSACSRHLLIWSPHLNVGLSLHLLPPYSVFHALFVNLSSLILCMYPAYRSLLPASFIIGCFFILISSRNAPFFLLSSRCTLHILLTQLFSAPCSFSCLSVRASVTNPYTQASTTQASNTFPFSCFFNFQSHIIPSTLLPAATACNLFCTSLLLPPSSHIVPHRYTHLSTA